MENEELNKMLKNFSDNGISHADNRLNEVLRFQDIIGRMNYNEIFDTYNTMEKTGKGNFLWASCSCLDKDMFLEIVRKVVCQSIISEEEERLEDRYLDRMSDIKAREKNMIELEKQNAVNLERIKYLELELKHAKMNMQGAIDSALKFNTIKDLLK